MPGPMGTAMCLRRPEATRKTWHKSGMVNSADTRLVSIEAFCSNKILSHFLGVDMDFVVHRHGNVEDVG